MGFLKEGVKVAVPQLEPAWLDLEGGIVKSIAAIEEAARNGAKLIAFSETWIPGYPDFLWANSFKDNVSQARNKRKKKEKDHQ